ncbi:MAG: EVE domain-containing protein [Verrucomicrobia bacterium]|nr:EVE domain-containing protein [Verrucomicrobiota bacterium]MDA1087315.1 EVE domain-containing protein [Verrucomicrobiota bacterium]
MAKRYWLMKSEAAVFSIDDLARDGKTHWEGVRNYQARNIMRDEMRVGDLVLYYHSNSDPTGVAGMARVCRTGYPDHTAFDAKSRYFDPKSVKDTPTWIMVDIEFVEKFAAVASLQDLKVNARLDGMIVIKRGMRLSVQPVDKKHFDEVCKMGKTR